jgi:4-amino-4-deoxy-L-arabinose transferase-like glycosyltransferase
MFSRFLASTDAQLLAWTLLTKVGVLAIGYAALWAATGAAPGPLDPWHRWDAPHYTDIAVFGYMADDPGNLSAPGYQQVFPGDLDLYIVFFPLFPWLVAGVNAVGGDPIASALVVSTVASLFVAPVLYRLVKVDLGDRIGRWSAGLLLVFPTAFFLHIGYTESLFLALAFGALWLARTNRWWLAGLLAALAALTRVNGLILVPALVVEALLQWRADPDRRLRVEWLAIAGAGIGFGIYLAVNQVVYGDLLAFSDIQREHWFKQLTWPWDGVARVFRWFDDPDPDSVFMYGGMELLFIAIGLVATVATAIWLRPTWAVWMAGNWLLSVSTGFVLSVPRYSLALFGIMVWAALIGERWRVAGWVIAAGSATAMAYFAWRFGSGHWAF